MEMSQAQCSSVTAALARGNFMFCLQGRKVGINAATAKGGYNTKMRVKSEDKTV